MLTGFQKNSDCFVGNPLFSDELLSVLSFEKIQSLKGGSRIVQFEKGENIFAKNEIPQFVYILAHGRAVLGSNSRKKQNIRLIEKEEIIGFYESLGNFPLETNVKTLSPCLFYRIDREEIINFLLEEPKICFHLLKIIGENLQKNYEFISNLSH